MSLMRKSLVDMRNIVQDVVSNRIKTRNEKEQIERERVRADAEQKRLEAERLRAEKQRDDVAASAIIAYYDNFGKHYRSIIVPRASLVFNPIEVRVDLPKNVGEGITPVFLTKRARKDVERSIEMQGKGKPMSYITPASQSKKGDFNQGVVYVIETLIVKKNAYYDFHKRKIDQHAGNMDDYIKNVDKGIDVVDEDDVIEEERKPGDGAYVSCKCSSCPNAIRGVGVFSCGVQVFKTPKDIKFIETDIYCNEFPVKQKTVHDNQD